MSFESSGETVDLTGVLKVQVCSTEHLTKHE